MRKSSFLGRLFSWSSVDRKRRKKLFGRRGSAPLFTPAIESLEDRAMLTAVTVNGSWYYFYFDPVAPGSFAEVYGYPAPYTFTHSTPTLFRISDSWWEGEQYEIFDFGTSIGTTSTPASPDFNDDVWTAPEAAYAGSQSGTRGFSTGDFLLPAGSHSLTIKLIAAEDDTISGGTGGFVLLEVPTLSIDDVTANENVGTMTFTVSVERTFLNGNIYVDYETQTGSAQSGDFTMQSGTITYWSGQNISSKTIEINVENDKSSESNESFFVNLTNARFTHSYPPPVLITDSQGLGTILKNDQPPKPVPPSCSSCGGGGGGDLIGSSGGGVSNSFGSPGKSDFPVRYADGTLLLSQTDIESQGFDRPWGITRSWANTPQNFQQNVIGYGMVISQQPYVLPVDGFSTVALLSNATTARYFDQIGTSNLYAPRFFLQETLEYNVAGGEYIVTDTTGAKLRFYDFFNATVLKRGQFKSYTDASGNVTTAIYSADGRIADVQRTAPSSGATESFVYTYVTSGPNTGLIASVTLRTGVGGVFNTLRKAEYAYYVDADANGSTGDLKTVTIKNGADAVLDTTYYRYYESESATGFKHGIKYVFMPESYARLAAALPSHLTAADAAVAPYADHYFEYNAQFMVSKEKAQGAGCACNGGLGEFNFTYYDRSTEPGYTADHNSWKMRTTESLPDGQNIVYTNDYGQVMLEVFHDFISGNKWATYYHYDPQGRVDFRADPSAVTGYDDSKPDLVDFDSGNYVHLNDATGLITDYTYYPATGFPTYGAPGYLSDIGIRMGEAGTIAAGTKIPKSHHTYKPITDGATTIYLPFHEIAYAAQNSGMPQITLHNYATAGLSVTYASTSTPTGGTETVPDVFSRPVWHKDPAGFIHYTEYDTLTGAVVKTIVDVATSLVSNEPSGWVTPTGGGTHAVTTYEVDGLGRRTKITDPNSNVTRIVYKDASHEVRIYEGITPGSNWPTTPIMVIRDDRARGYTEVLTMAATTPTIVSGVFTGNEPIANVQSLSRTLYNSAGQAVSARDYFNLAGLTYSTDVAFGTLDTHYYERTLAYDNRGRENRVKRADGTIYRTVYDGLGRPTSEWIGTNDTPASGSWSVWNSAAMVRVKAYTYDNDGAGDSHLTSVTDVLNRTTTMGYDIQGRLASTTLPDPDNNPATSDVAVYRQDYDNLGRVVAVTDATGLFDADHKTQIIHYDSSPPSVLTVRPDPDGSGPLNTLDTYQYFDHRGLLTSVREGYGRTTSYTYDVGGRLTSVTEPDADPGDSNPSPTTTFAYDDVGNLTSSTDPRGQTTYRTYDRANRLETVTEPDPDGSNPLPTPVTYYAYDQAGQLLNLTDPNNNVTTWLYDALGRVTSETNVLNKTRLYEYDAASRLTKKTDRLGRITRYEYNTFDQTTAEKWYDGETLLRTLGYTYDAAGQLTGTSDPDAEYVYTLDRMGRVTTQTQNITGLMPSTSPDIEYVSQYNTDSFRTELTAKIGGVNDFKNTYVPDKLQRLTSLIQEGNGGNAVAAKRVDFAYNDAGQFDTISRYAGTTTSELVANTFYRYDDFGRLDQLVHTTDTTAPTSGWGSGIKAGYQYTYDGASRIDEIDSYWDGLSTYGYDETNQLTSTDHASQSDETYAYDLNGNRSNATTIGANNQLLSDGLYNYAYDAEGNRIRRTEIATGLYSRYAYDHRNRLTSVVDVNPALAAGNPLWGQTSGGDSAIATIDLGSDLGSVRYMFSPLALVASGGWRLSVRRGIHGRIAVRW